MKVMVEFSFAAQHGNEVIRSGKVKAIFDHLVADLKPEAAYMYPLDGQRGGHFIVNVSDASEVGTIAERFWFALKADVKLTPVMGPADLQKALGGIGDIIKRFGE